MGKWFFRCLLIFLVALSIWPSYIVTLVRRLPVVGESLASFLAGLSQIMPWCKGVDEEGHALLDDSARDPSDTTGEMDDIIPRLKHAEDRLDDIAYQVSLLANSEGSGADSVGSKLSWHLPKPNDPLRLEAIAGLEMQDGRWQAEAGCGTHNDLSGFGKVVCHVTYQVAESHLFPGKGGTFTFYRKDRVPPYPSSTSQLVSSALDSTDFSHHMGVTGITGVANVQTDVTCKEGRSLAIGLAEENEEVLVSSASTLDFLIIFREEVSNSSLKNVIALRGASVGPRWNQHVEYSVSVPWSSEKAHQAKYTLYGADAGGRAQFTPFPSSVIDQNTLKGQRQQALKRASYAELIATRNERGIYAVSQLRRNVLKVTIPAGAVPQFELVFPEQMAACHVTDVCCRTTG